MAEERKDQRKLGEMLVENGVITQRQLEEALKEQGATGRFIGEVLVSRSAASEQQVTQSLSEQLGFAFVDLANMAIEPEARDAVQEELCSKHIAVPLFIVQNTLTLAMSNPLDIEAIDEFQVASGFRVKPVFACPTAIRNAIEKQYHQVEPELPQALSTPQGGHFSNDQVASLREAANLAPLVSMVNSIITRAVETGASDIHLEPEKDNFNCRYRIDGILYPASQIPMEDQAAVISRIKIMGNMDIAEKRLPQDGRIRMHVAGRDVDLRVSTFPSIYGENVVIRILDRSGGVLKLEQLGLSKNMLTSLSDMIRRPYGTILVTGPTGSGKTTSLYAALSEINTVEKNIITLEDPVEYEISHIRQSQVNVKAGLTFATGLRSVVRQDPDIIMIGEIRDKETADIAVHAALTGHLVFSTLHTNDAPSAATRLIDMGVEPFLAASAMTGILAQRLMRTLCPHCKTKYTPPLELLKQLGIKRQEKGDAKHVFYKEAGCKKCKQRGYTGRIGIFELLIPNERIRNLISQKVSAAVLREEATKAGMRTLRDDGLEKVVSGLTSVSELLRVTEEV